MPLLILRNCVLALLVLGSAGSAAEQARSGPGGAIPYREEKPAQESTSHALIASVVLAGLAGAALFLGRRRFPHLMRSKPDSQLVSILESRSLGGAARLWVIEFEGERLLLAQSGTQLTLLANHAIPSSADGIGDREAG